MFGDIILQEINISTVIINNNVEPVVMKSPVYWHTISINELITIKRIDFLTFSRKFDIINIIWKILEILQEKRTI